jgi:type IV pilus assembly protein PilW
VSKQLRSVAGRDRGFTLVELMVSMLLGLIIIGGATAVIVANRQSYRTNEGLSQLQESARTAFELMARDIRQAGVTGCDSKGKVANVVLTSPTAWWQNWFVLRGFAGDQNDGAATFGTGAMQRVAGTDSLHAQGLDGNGIAVQLHTPSAATIRLNAGTMSIAAGDILMACDFEQSTIFMAASYNTTTNTISHASSAAGSPRNCTAGLGHPTNCTTANLHTYKPGSQVARLMAVDWFVGNNGRGDGRSLYRWRMGAAQPDEMVAGVSAMNLRYLEEGEDDFGQEADVNNWANVTAVEVQLTIDSADRNIASDPAVNSGRLQRVFTNVITLRNRVS